MKPQEIRQSFVDFFVQRGHLHYKSASLVPEAFSTTLFTIAGMEQFVPVFLGDEDPPAQNAVTVQRCLRVAGGKNDLENVGRSGRHGTLLEMLGNFSFGGYYKREAIVWAWEYLTGVLRLAPDRLYATVYTDDDEAEDIWKRDVGLAADRVSRFREDNFWDMGPTGPCGPCSEIFYDLGASVGCGRDDCKVGCSHCNRYIELWNLVFQQYDRDAGGELHPLPRKCIDTGMGFERLCMVMAGATSIFETDLYQSIIRRLPTSRKTCPLPESEQIVHKNIIADHGRAAVFLAADGVVPSNTDRGYVMRFLIRRAIRSGKLLYLPDSFLSNLVPTIVASLSDWYPELAREQEKAADLIRFEEKAFSSTIQRATDILADQVAALKGRHQRIPGDLAFKLHDTYGLPPELQMEIVRDFGFSEGIDMEGYRAAMDEQRERARRDAQKKRADVRVVPSQTVDLPDSDFVGYEQLEATARIAAIYDLKGNAVNSIEQGQDAMLLLDRTPFYAERGGQAGDQGVVARGDTVFEVSDTQYQDKKSYQHILHRGKLKKGSLQVGQTVEAIVDPGWRREIRRHHTVTHLLQRALKEIVGDSIAQRGSAVYPDHTRFDFDSPSGALTQRQEAEVTARVNELIRSDFHRDVEIMPFDAAIGRGAVYMKGEHYGDRVRVVTFGPSVELCGGTHVESTGEIGLFVLTRESAIAAGIRRVEGVVSESADKFVTLMRSAAEQAGSVLVAPVEKLPESVARLAAERRDLEKQLASLQSQLAAAQAAALISNARSVDGIPYLTARASDAATVKTLSEAIRQQWPSGVLAVAGTAADKVSVLVTISEDVAGKGVTARKILDAMMTHLEGKGGGSATVAQGGGKNVSGLDKAFDAVVDAIRSAVNV